MLPHITEELWSVLGHTTPLVESRWPTAEKELLVDSTVTVAVQVNGKLRGTLVIAKDADNSVVETQAKEIDAVQRALEGKTIKKVIVIPNRIVNIVGA